MKICEDFVNRPSPSQEGWNQWGSMDGVGNFTPVYGLESHHDHSSAMYFLAAAGKCQIRGQYALGQPSPETPPAIAPAPATTEEMPVQETQPITEVPAAVDEPVSNPAIGWVEGALPWVMIGGVLLLWGGTVWSKRKRKTTDPTPNTVVKNPFAPKEGE
jgi:hypothetical protein